MEENDAGVQENTMVNKQSNKMTPVVWVLIIVSMMAAVAAGFLYLQATQRINQMTNNDINKTDEISSVVPEPTVDPSALPTPSSSEEVQLPVLVYAPPLQTAEYSSKRAEVQRKVVSPYLDYYKYQCEKAEWGCLVSVMVEQREGDVMYPYSISHITTTGGYGGELLMQTEGTLNWWAPTCMGKCELPDDYLSKYPEIGKLIGE